MAIAELDPDLITKRKRMLDSVGQYARPDIFTLTIDREARTLVRPKFEGRTLAAGEGGESGKEAGKNYEGHYLFSNCAPHQEKAAPISSPNPRTPLHRPQNPLALPDRPPPP